MVSLPDGGAAFATATFDAFDRASEAARATSEVLTLAGRTLRVRYVGSELARRFTPAMEHLASTRDAPYDFEICCWERDVTDVVPPRSPWGTDDHLAHGRIRGQVDGRVRATFDASARVLALYDRDRRCAALVAADARSVPAWMDRAPFRTILTWWAADSGLALLHASAVANADGAVVFAGTSGSGKSTTALACVAAGMEFIGDDACVVEPRGEPSVHSVYGLAKLEPDAAARLPALARLAIATDDDQTLVHPGGSTCSRAPLRAILLPSVTGTTTTRAVQVDALDAMRTLVPTTLLEGGGAVRTSLGTLHEVVSAVPCFRLALGGDLDGVVDTVRTVLASAP